MKPRQMLPVNEVLLKARFPSVYKKILQVGDRMPDSFYFEGSGGKERLMIQRGEHSFCPYGDKNPSNLIKRWYKALNMVGESLYAITGFGDGSHLLHFLRESGTGINFLVAEKDPALLREVLARKDFTELLGHQRFILGTGEPDDDFFAPIQGAALTGVNDINSVVFSPLHSVDEIYYDKVRNELVRQYLVIRPLMEVNVRTATNLQENTFRNLPHMAQAPDVGELKGEFPEIPFVLVGAGPSLDESIEFLRKVEEKAIIIASNSSYRKLINSDIKPHMVVTADPMSPTLAGFQNISLEGVPLACPFSAYPEIVSRFSGRIFSWCTFNPIVDIVKAYMGQKPGTVIMEQGTVSGCVLDLSRLFGCKKVMFVGQDMAVREDGRYYTDDSSYADHGRHYAVSAKGQRLPGNTQEKVLVEQRLFVYLKTFEQFIAKKSLECEYRNLARTGVKIEGAPYCDYDDALEWIGDSSNKAFKERISELLNRQGDCPDLSKVFEGAKIYVEEVYEKALAGAIKSELLPEKYAGTNYSGHKSIKELLKGGGELNKLVDSNNIFWNFLLEGKTKGELVTYQRALRDIDFPSKNWTAVQGNREYFWALSEGCHWLLETLDENIESRTWSQTAIS
tara:strand:- start:27698 stop:29563 length:1866 start_codon:yes stop_codon:yes gene_type:complete